MEELSLEKIGPRSIDRLLTVDDGSQRVLLPLDSLTVFWFN